MGYNDPTSSDLLHGQHQCHTNKLNVFENKVSVNMFTMFANVVVCIARNCFFPHPNSEFIEFFSAFFCWSYVNFELISSLFQISFWFFLSLSHQMHGQIRSTNVSLQRINCFFFRLCMPVSTCSPLNIVPFSIFASLAQQWCCVHWITFILQDNFNVTSNLNDCIFFCVSSVSYRLTSIRMEVFRYQRWLFVRFPMMMAPFWSVKAQIHDYPIQHWKIRWC